MTVVPTTPRGVLAAFGAHLPNLLSLARLVVAPLTIWLILLGEFTGAFWLFCAAALTDALDGILARWLHARTAIGSYLDPIADKMLLVGTYIALAWVGSLPGWLVALVVARDVGLVIGVLALYAFGWSAPAITPSKISKLNTLMQIALAVAALALPALAVDAGWVIWALIWGVAATTLLSGAGYLFEAIRLFAGLGTRA